MTDTKQNLKNAMFLIERLIEEELNFIVRTIFTLYQIASYSLKERLHFTKK